MEVRFIISGEAVPASRPRFGGFRDRCFGAGSPIVYTPERYANWLTLVAIKAHEGRHHIRTLSVLFELKGISESATSSADLHMVEREMVCRILPRLLAEL